MSDCYLSDSHNAHYWRDGPSDEEFCDGRGDEEPLSDEDEAVLDGHEAQDRDYERGMYP